MSTQQLGNCINSNEWQREREHTAHSSRINTGENSEHTCQHQALVVSSQHVKQSVHTYKN